MTSAPPSICFLGPFAAARGAEPIALPASQKTRALLAYLALTGRPQRRERLCSMFWDVADDPRGALRWSLSKLRALDDEGARRIVADRQAVSFDPAGAYVDVLHVRRIAANGLAALSTEELRELATAFRGGFLDGVELPDFDEFQAWRVAEREQLRSLHANALRALVDRLADDPEAAVAPARDLVRLAPDDIAGRAALVRLLAATGRREEAEEHFNLGRRYCDKEGIDDRELRDAWRDTSSAPAVDASAADADVSRQQVRFCRAPDGVSIAYASLGQGPPLVKTSNWMSHLEYDWKSPLWRHLARDLARDFTLVRYDQRGNGLSDWDVDDFSLDAVVSDLEVVVDAAGLERFPLLGVSQGCRIAIAYAVRHPDKVTHLILYGGSPRGWKHRPRTNREARGALQPLIRMGWGQDTPAFRQVFTTLFMPDANAEQVTWFNELQRVSTSPENAARISEASAEVDVTDLLDRVTAPTLVMHAIHDAMAPFDEARILAAGIPGARFVALESNNHLLLDDEPAFARFLSEIRAFLTEPG